MARVVGDQRTDGGACVVVVGAGWRRGSVVVDVQEDFEAAEKALSGRGFEWLHDRHGAILKEYRLIEVPILVIVDSEGRLEARLSPDPGAVAEWAG